MERYLREQFLLEEEMREKLAAPFDFVHLKTAQPAATAQDMNVQAPPEQTAGAESGAPPTSPDAQGVERKRAALQQVLDNLQKSPVVALFSKKPPQEAEDTPTAPPDGNPQQGLPKTAASGKAPKKTPKISFPQTALPKLKKTPAGSKTTATKTLKPTLQTKYRPPKVPTTGKLPKVVVPAAVKPKVNMNRKVKPVDVLRDKKGEA